MKFTFEADAAASPNPPAYLPYPLPDLRAEGAFRLRRDVVGGQVFISGFVRNIGNQSFRKPFTIALGVTITQETESSFEIVYSTERRSTIGGMDVGERAETAETQAPLIYRDQGNARYDVELLVDIYNDVSELTSLNNRSQLQTYLIRPDRQVDGELVLVNKLPA